MSTTDPLVHQVMGPYVPEAAQYSTQRYFSQGNSNHALSLQGNLRDKKPYQHRAGSFEVLRFAQDDYAEMHLSVCIQEHSAGISVICNASELREIAARLLDAANDLEVNSAKELMADWEKKEKAHRKQAGKAKQGAAA